jgi:hypothetical protein
MISLVGSVRYEAKKVWASFSGNFRECDGWRSVRADRRKLAPGQAQIFAIVQVPGSRFADVKGLGAPGDQRQFNEAAFRCGWQSDGKYVSAYVL